MLPRARGGGGGGGGAGNTVLCQLFINVHAEITTVPGLFLPRHSPCAVQSQMF